MSYTVGQRIKEMGIRMALGADPADVLRLVMRWGATFVAVGVSAGLLGAYAAARFVGGMLYGVGAADAGAYATGAGVLALVALVACYLPARRATSPACLALR